MKRFALIALGVVAVAAGALAQAPPARPPPPPPPPLEAGASQAEVDTALLAAPANLKDQATVIRRPDQPTRLRKGTNRLVCFDRSGFPLMQPFSVECTSLGNLDRVAQNQKTDTRRPPKAGGIRRTKAGTRVSPSSARCSGTSSPDKTGAAPLTVAVRTRRC
jgi:hypothetical protein